MAAPIEQSGGVDGGVCENNDNFREQFKRYKRRKPPPDFSEVIDFMNSDLVSRFHPKLTCQPCETTVCRELGLKPVNQWRCFTLRGAPGFVYIENPFSPGYQRYWVQRCLRDYPKKPNVSNLDGHHANLGDVSLWDDSMTKSSSDKSKKCLMDQLRWVTLGYHYDWTSKLYYRHRHTAFPSDLAGLSAFVAAVMGYPTFSPQAAIVNYYHLDSTLGGHTDHSEFDLAAPIISYSFGQSAVFLLGGRTKTTSPLAIYLHSGDIIIMGGESRLAYHAVPRILKSSGPSKLPACLDRVDASELGSIGQSPSEQFVHDSTKSENCNRDCCLQLATSKACESANLKSFPESDSGKRSSSSDTKMTSKETEMCSRTQECDLHGSNSRIDTSSEKDDEIAGPRAKRDGYSRTECRLRCVSERLTEFDHAQIGATTAALQDDGTWEPFANFMSRSRINISVRQITGPGCDFPAESSTADHESSVNAMPACPGQEDDNLSAAKRKVECLDHG